MPIKTPIFERMRMGNSSTMTASSQAGSNNTIWSFPFPEQDWHHTPRLVQHYIVELQNQLNDLKQQHDQLQKQVDTLQGRVAKTSQTSSKPPSSDSPFTKPQHSKRHMSSGKRGAREGHPGSGPTLLEPTEVQHLYPALCACGHGELATPTLYHTHQMIELPPIAMQITHFLLYQAPCVGCGRITKADVPSAYATGYGPRLSGLMGELSGMHGTSRRLMQDFCHSVLHIPISLGAIQKVIDRVSCAILPHYEAIAELARNATVGYIDETPWFCQNTMQWLWRLPLRIGEIFGARLYLIYRELFVNPIKKRRLDENAGKGFLERLNVSKSLSFFRLNKQSLILFPLNFYAKWGMVYAKNLCINHFPLLPKI